MDREFLLIGVAMVILGLLGIVLDRLVWVLTGFVSPTFNEGFTALAGLVLAFGAILIPVGIVKGGVPTGGAAKVAFAVTGLIILAGVEATGVLNFAPSGPSAPTTTVTRSIVIVNVSMIQGSVLPSQAQNFVPRDIVVVLGVNNTVRWTNDDGFTHTVTSGGNFDSGNMSPGKTFEWTFTRPGTFNYICTLHPGWMKGSVTVKSP